MPAHAQSCQRDVCSWDPEVFAAAAEAFYDGAGEGDGEGGGGAGGGAGGEGAGVGGAHLCWWGGVVWWVVYGVMYGVLCGGGWVGGGGRWRREEKWVEGLVERGGSMVLPRDSRRKPYRRMQKPTVGIGRFTDNQVYVEHLQSVLWLEDYLEDATRLILLDF